MLLALADTLSAAGVAMRRWRHRLRDAVTRGNNLATLAVVAHRRWSAQHCGLQHFTTLMGLQAAKQRVCVHCGKLNSYHRLGADEAAANSD